jgi:Spy/CpxP family protein refolding chaperone
MKKRLALIALALAAVVAVPLVYAHGGGGRRADLHGGPGMHGWGHGAHGLQILGGLRHLSRELDLTTQQEEQIEGILKKTHEQNAQYREQMHGRLKGVAEVLLANPANVTGAESLLDANLEAERALKSNLIKAASQALAVLTPEQRTRLRTIMAEHMEELESRRGR